MPQGGLSIDAVLVHSAAGLKPLDDRDHCNLS